MKHTLDIAVPVIPDAILLAVQEIASGGGSEQALETSTVSTAESGVWS